MTSARRRRFIYMNEEIRKAEPARPVIVVQSGDRLTESNLVRLVLDGIVVAEVRFLEGGLKEAPGHQVRAYLEVFGDTEIHAA